MRISDWSSDVCSSDLRDSDLPAAAAQGLLDRVEHAEVAGQVDDVPLLGQRPLQTAQIARLGVHVGRREERRVGKECVSPGSNWWSPIHFKETNYRTADAFTMTASFDNCVDNGD